MTHLLSQTPVQPSETNSLPLAPKSDDEFTLGSIKDLDELRQPILNLPDFATSDWFKKHLSVSRILTARNRRRAAAAANHLRAVSYCIVAHRSPSAERRPTNWHAGGPQMARTCFIG
jgi:hypothetical protein